MFTLMVIIAAVFASTFLILNVTGVLTIARIELLLISAQTVSPVLIGICISMLLFLDLFVAMPTLTIIILSGYFLGPMIGSLFSIIGLSSAGLAGYFLSNRFGDRMLELLLRKQEERESAIISFRKYGIVTILLSRAAPILPEVSACMAGLTNLKFSKFILAWLVSTVPYTFIASYAGSISSLSRPQPALYAALGLTMFFWLSWFIFRKRSGYAT